jgi:indole-3-glycerol phosphate synthase
VNQGFLAEMAAESTRRAREAGSRRDLSSLAESSPPARPLRFGAPGFDVIGEAKLASPSEGVLASGGEEEVVRLVREYAAAGAAAVSVLTEESRFGGRLSHLEAASHEVGVPVLRKDFLVDPVQIMEARAFGASGVLLIARMLSERLLQEMVDSTLSMGMFVLLEVFDRDDLELAAPVLDRDILLGVNCRDLTTLEVDLSRFEVLAPQLPSHLPRVAESGINTTDDAAAIADLGYQVALVGSALVSNVSPGGLLSDLIDAGRRARAGAGT